MFFEYHLILFSGLKHVEGSNLNRNMNCGHFTRTEKKTCLFFFQQNLLKILGSLVRL